MLAGGCGRETATQVIVRLYADPSVAPEADALRVSVLGEGRLREERVDPVSREQTLLAVVPLVPEGGDATRSFEVVAELLAGGRSQATLRVGGGYEAGSLRFIDAGFDAEPECAQRGDCGPGSTCEEGRCVGACFEGGADDPAREAPRCAECEACVRGRCQPLPTGNACGCPGDTCMAGRCEPQVPAAKVWAGEHQTCASASGSLYCWGNNRARRVGLGPGTSSDVPVRIDTTVPGWPEAPRSVVSVAPGADHTCLLWTRPGPDRARTCWGWNGRGALGLAANSTEAFAPTEAPASEPDWVELVAGRFHTCGLAPDGQLWCWGSSSRGQAGPAPSEGLPRLVDMRRGWTQVSAGDEMTCGVIEGRAECFGSGTEGALGNGMRQDSPVPSCVVDADGECIDDFFYVAAGSTAACGLRGDGAVWCWGDNEGGLLGVEAGALVLRAAPVDTTLRFRRLTMLRRSVCGLTVEGQLACWGDNRGRFGGGHLGVGDREPRARPTLVSVDPGDRWQSVSMGAGYACGVRVGGELYCWGSNDAPSTGIPVAAGRLGLGFGLDVDDPATGRDVLTPRRVCLSDALAR